MQSINAARRWLVAAVVGHLVITVLHGSAHNGAHVATTPLQNIFILVVIVVGPLAGLWMSLRGHALGGWVVAATMAGSLVFGVVNHFILPSGDRIDHVMGPWSFMFGASAAGLAITEAAGVVAGFVYALRRLEQSS